MKIVLDMQGVQSDSRHRGIGRYVRASAIEFTRHVQNGHDVTLMFNAALDGIDEAITDFADAGLCPARKVYGPVRGTASDSPSNDARREAAGRVLTHALNTSGADIVWIGSLIEGYAEDALAPHELPQPFTVATLYDLIPLHDDTYLGKSRARDWYLGRVELLRRCDLLLAISSWVREDAIQRLGVDPQRIVTIGAGVDPMFRPAAPGADQAAILKQRLGVDKPFVLYNGGADKRKNVDVLFAAFAALPPPLRDTYQLVVAGRLDYAARARFDGIAHALGLPSTSVVFPGYVSDEDLVRLYQGCALFVFPSAQEGFGLPPLEAMACGAPVLVNRATSLPEVVGDPSAMFDATSPESITSTMRDVLENPARTAALRESGLRRAARFTWPEVAARAATAIEAAWSAHKAPRHGPAPTWATVAAVVEAQRARDVTLPLYLLDEGNAVGLLPSLHAWPGLVEWHGPLPSPRTINCIERYRVGGWQAVLSDDQVDWTSLLAHASIATRYVDSPQEFDERQSWVASQTTHPLAAQRAVEDAIAGTVAPRLDEIDLARVADALDRLRPPLAKRWLVDVTHIAVEDLATGIQRVVRSVLARWLRSARPGVRIEPVAFREGRYHHAHAYAAALIGAAVPDGLLEDAVTITGSEVFIGLDWAMESLPSSASLLRTWRRAGVGMHFIAHDLLPITLPGGFHPQTRESFVRWLRLVVELADAVHCVSRSTADDLADWMQTERVRRTPALTTFPLGVEPRVTRYPVALEPDIAAGTAARPSFLMVGTIEPRKGHEQALDAMELLWASNADVNLIIIGKRGWLVGELIQRLERHNEAGRRLFWLEGCTDATLDALYQASTALLAPSLGEGFGLPVIEAAQRGKPVIARSLKVFREVAGDYPSYFEGTSAAALSTYLARWLADRPARDRRDDWPDWDVSAATLARHIAQA